MRILFLNRSYYPDVEATGQLLAELCTDLGAAHDVTVIAGQPNFVASGGARAWVEKETHEGVNVLRVSNRRFNKRSMLGRAFGLASYLVLAAWAALTCRRPEVIVVETDPPFLGALGAFLKWWHRCPLVFYLQDLFPEVGLALGKFKPGPLTWLLHAATQVGLRAADRVVVLGDDMKERVRARGIPLEKVAIVPNWSDVDAVRPVEGQNPLKAEWGLANRFTVMYSGNLGLSQNLEQLLAAARDLRDEPIQFLLVGEGAAKEALRAQAGAWGLDNVRFLPYQPKDRLAESLSAPDLHFIPLRRGLAGCIVPSKLYGVLAAGRAYVASVESASEVARVTRIHDTGLVIEPDEAGPLTSALRWCLQNRKELEAMGRRGRELAETTYNRATSVAAFAEVLRQAVRPARCDAPGGRPETPRPPQGNAAQVAVQGEQR